MGVPVGGVWCAVVVHAVGVRCPVCAVACVPVAALWLRCACAVVLWVWLRCGRACAVAVLWVRLRCGLWPVACGLWCCALWCCALWLPCLWLHLIAPWR
ncbi:MAG: hypothetical protein IPN53_18365 [Comamonadaceae bacterium]|nr:hypothetical protein [Comamonadaceae bacterium]